MKSLMLAFIIIITAHVCFGGTIHVPGDRASIQSGIDAASEGDTVLIGAGLYVENITIDNPIHLIGQEKNSTIIDGAAAGDVILITSDNVHVANMSITNGGAEIPLEEAWDAGIKLEAVDSCLVENCKLFGNNAAGMSVGNSSFNVVERCIFINNYAGIYFYTDIGSLPVSNNHHNLLRYNKIYDN